MQEQTKSKQKIGFTGLILPLICLIMGFVFIFLIRFTPEFECVMDIVSANPEVIAELGEPVKPGFIALTSRYGSVDDSSAFEARFRAPVSGPNGSGWVKADIYRSPIGSAMTIEFGDMVVYNGIYACP